MIIGGVEKLSVLDYPGHLAAIVFTSGCNFRCRYCYNPELVFPKTDKEGKLEASPLISNEELLLFLKERFGRLEAVVITGGEPTLHADLPEFIRKIRDIGYLIKLDSNGSNPEMLQSLIDEKLLDYIAMDVKAGKSDYEKVVGAKINFNNIEKSIKIIKESGVDHEFRTTLTPGLVDKSSFLEIGKLIKGAKKWYLQNFKSDTNLVDQSLINTKPFSSKEMKEFADLGKNYSEICKSHS